MTTFFAGVFFAAALAVGPAGFLVVVVVVACVEVVVAFPARPVALVFFTTVVLVLDADALLWSLTTRRSFRKAGRGGGGMSVFVLTFSLLAVRPILEATVVPRLACSAMPCKAAVMALVAAAVAAVFNGDAGFSGDTGREI